MDKFASRKYVWLSAVLVTVVSLSYEGIIEKAAISKWILLLFPPVVSVIKYLSGDDTVSIRTNFWVTATWACIYTIIGFILLGKMFIKKER